MCSAAFSCLWKQNYHWRCSQEMEGGGRIEKGHGRWSGRSRGKVEKVLRGFEIGKGWEGSGRMHLTFMFPTDKKCHLRLASLFHSLLLSLASLWLLPISWLFLPPPIGHLSSQFPASTSSHFNICTIWPLAFIQAFLHLPPVISISQAPTHATSRPSFVSLPLLILCFWIFSLPSFPSHTFICISSFSLFFSIANPPPHPSPHTSGVRSLGSRRWWGSYSLPDEAIANGCWIMHGRQDLESPVY